MKPRALAILGASGHAKVVAEAALAAGWESVSFFDDAWPNRSTVGQWAVIGDTPALQVRATDFAGVIVGIGDCATRLRLQDVLERFGAPMISVVHPRAWVSPSAELGAGTVVMAGAVINAGSRIGRACIVNTGSTVDHDCELADGVHVAPGANLSGAAQIGAMTWIGVGASVRQATRIGARVIIGAGAAVVSDVEDGQTYAGVPARPLRRSNPDMT